jgi:hypothetical protein
MDDWISKLLYIYAMEYYPSIKENEGLNTYCKMDEY